jgi:hypothetical protein
VPGGVEKKTKGKETMKAITMHKRVIAIAMATLMIAAVTTVSAFAYTTPPTPDYFFMDPDFNTPAPMGNATVFDVEDTTISGVDYTLLFFQPEFYTRGDDYVGSIDSFEVYDNAATPVPYETIIPGNIAQINKTWAKKNTAGQQYYQADIGIQLFDITTGQFATHMVYTVYYKINN